MVDTAVADLLNDDPWEWRAVWMAGLVALARGDPAAAQSAFNAVYGQVPGELAPKLALAIACRAERRVRRCRGPLPDLRPHRRQLHRTGCIRPGPIRTSRNDLDGALGALDLVPRTSGAYVRARRQRAGLLAGSGRGLPALAQAMDSITALTIDPVDRADLAADVFRTALAEVQQSGPQEALRIDGRAATESALRDGLEATYRLLADQAETRPERIALVDQANEVRAMDVAMTSTHRDGLPQLWRAGVRGRSLLRGLRRRAHRRRPRHQLDSAGHRRPNRRSRSPLRRSTGGRSVQDVRRHRSAPTGYCETCGTKAAKPRDHFDGAARAVGGRVCDRGIRHSRNEDAMALAADAEPGSRARARGLRRRLLTRSTPTSPAWPPPAQPATYCRPGTHRASAPSRPGAARSRRRLEAAADAASDAVVDTHRSGQRRTRRPAPSSRLSWTNGLLVAGNVGDSRAYWLPDDG